MAGRLRHQLQALGAFLLSPQGLAPVFTQRLCHRRTNDEEQHVETYGDEDELHGENGEKVHTFHLA